MNESANKKVRKEYSYFAFISYSRKDEKWAEWLQTRLENYRLPAALRKENVDLPAKIFPVFRDKTDLSGVGVEESLHRELEASKYLIVICSKNAGASEWVSKEVEYFISLGRQDAILPFIIEEEGFAEDDCYPEALRSRKSDLLGISVAELGRRRAFLRVVSTLLELRYDQVVMREEKRQRNRQLLAAMAALVVSVVTGAVIWYNIPHSKYYSAYIYHYEIPQGIHELSKKDRQGLYHSYRITTQRGRVISLECVNSAGAVVEPMLSIGATDVPMMEYQYDAAGQLISADLRDVHGQLISHQVYSYHLEGNQIAVDFRTPSNGIQAMAMSADQALGDMIQTGNDTRSQITRRINLYDDNGYLIHSTYQKDNLGTVACDSNGVFGKQYTYTENGQILRATNLDADGQEHNCVYGWAAMEYTYDDMGRVISLQYYDAQGNKVRGQDKVSLQTMTYDDKGNAGCLEIFDEDGDPCLCENGYAVRTCVYDDRGFVTDVYQFGLDDQPAMGTEHVHRWHYETDENGRIIRTSLYGIHGESVYSDTYRFSSETRILDDQGRVIEQWNYGVDGEKRARASGAYGERTSYDQWGNISEIVYLDAQGNPMLTTLGYASIRQYCNESGSITRVEYLDTQGQLVRGLNHVAVELAEYDVFGNQTREYYLDENGEPCYLSDGIHSVDLAFENGRPTSIRYFDVYGEPIYGQDGYHEGRLEYDVHGHTCRLSFYDCVGNLISSSLGYAVIEMDRDEYGRTLETRCFDSSLQPVGGENYWRLIREYDKRGNMIREQAFYLEDNREYSCIVFVYDENDRKTEEHFCDEEGELLQTVRHQAKNVYAYDSAGNVIREESLNADGSPFRYEIIGSVNYREYEYDACGNETTRREYHRDLSGELYCQYITTFVYDPYGNCIREEYRDGEGQLRLVGEKPGYAIHLMGYDEWNRMVWEEYYDAAEAPCIHEDNAFRYEYVCDEYGLYVEIRHYDTDGQPVRSSDGRYALQKIIYNDYRDILKLQVYDENGKLLFVGENSYDERGYLTRDLLSYADGGIIHDEIPFLMITSVQEGSHAQEAGIRAGDLLLRFGTWDYLDKEAGAGSYEWMKTEINKNAKNEKEVVVAYPLEGMKFDFRKMTLPEGLVGFGYTAYEASLKDLTMLRDAYAKWISTEE